jgi:hypothetical protein
MKTQQFLAFVAAALITFFLTIIVDRLIITDQVGSSLHTAARAEEMVDQVGAV